MKSLTLTIFAISLLLFSSIHALGQQPSFNGFWTINKSESKGKGADGSKFGFNRNVEVRVDHTEPRIYLVATEILGDGSRRDMENSLFYTDGRGESNPSESGEFTSKTKWSGNKLVIQITRPKKKSTKEKEEWRLSADGQKFFRNVEIRDEIIYQLNGKETGRESYKTEFSYVYDRVASPPTPSH